MDSYLQDNSGDMQYSASNPVRTEFHFSALHHGDYVLWAELWFVVCGCVLVCYGAPKIFRKLLRHRNHSSRISRAGPTTTVISFLFSVHLRALCREFYGISKLISPSPIYPNDRAQVQKVHTTVLAEKKKFVRCKHRHDKAFILYASLNELQLSCITELPAEQLEEI